MIEPVDSLFAIDRLPGYKHQYKDMSSHQTFTFKLGLELCMSYVTQEEDLSATFDQEFLQDLHNRNKVFELPLHKCHVCGFKTESKLVLDTHLAEPHLLSTTNVCNFCPNFRSKSKEKYLEHLLNEHKRVAKMEKPFIDQHIMCPVCDYETTIGTVTPKLCDIDRTSTHIHYQCPFRHNNQDVNPMLKIDYKQILQNNLSPSQFDLLDYEFMFNRKPVDPYINKFNLFSASLLKTNSALALIAVQEESFMVQQTKLLESILYNKPINIVQKENIEMIKSPLVITSTTKINQIPARLPIKIAPSVSPINNKPIQTVTYSTNPIKCDLCTVCFGGTFALVNYEAHLKTVHSIRNVQDLRACLRKCFRPVEQKMSGQSIKVIKINQNLVLVRKNPNEMTPVTSVKRPIEVIDLEKEDEITKKVKINENNELLIQVKLKEIDNEKKFIYSLLKIQKNDSDLVELKGIPGVCYVCKHNFQNLLIHLNQEHQIDACKSFELFRCILCGSVENDKNDLIKHQYEKHNLISFSSLNKIFTVNGEHVKKSNDEAPKSDCIVLDDEEQTTKEPAKNIINLKIDSKEEKSDKGDVNVKKCVKCSKKFDTFTNLLNHVKNEHKTGADNEKVDEKNECKIPDDTQGKIEESVSNISLCSRKLTCQFCNYSDMESGSDYEMHMMRNHMKRCQIRVRKLSTSDDRMKIKMIDLQKRESIERLNESNETILNKKIKKETTDDSNRRRSSRLRK